MHNCTHLDQIKDVKPSAQGCEECLKTGRLVGASAHLPYLRARGLLRPIAEQTRHEAFSRHRASYCPVDRAG
jgi:hypothetical protein